MRPRRRERAPEIVAAEQAVDLAKRDAATELAARKNLLRIALHKLGVSIEEGADDLIDTFQKAGD